MLRERTGWLGLLYPLPMALERGESWAGVFENNTKLLILIWNKKGRGIIIIIHRLEAQCLELKGCHTGNADVLLELLSVWNLMKTGLPLRCAGV